MNQKGAIHLLLIVVALGILTFLVLSSTLNFKDKLFSTLYPKPKSQAAEVLKQEIKEKTDSLQNLSKDSSALDNSISIAKDRKEQMLSLADQDAEGFLELAITKEVKSHFPQEMKDYIEEEVVEEGKYIKLHIDKFSDRTTTNLDALETKDKNILSLKVPTSDTNPKAGSNVKVTGFKLDNKIVAKSMIEQTSKDKVLGTSITYGTAKVAIFVFKYQEDNVEPWLISDIQNQVDLNNGWLNKYTYENSLKQMNITADVFGYFTISTSTVNLCDTGLSLQYARSVANNYIQQNLLPNTYQRFIYLVPNTCLAGQAIVYFPYSSGNEVYSTVFEPFAILHELNYTFGAWSADYYKCIHIISSGGGGIGGNIPSLKYAVAIDLPNQCTLEQFGDPFDVMGSQLRQMNGWNKGQTGILNPANTLLVTKENISSYTSNGILRIYPIEEPYTNTQVLKIPRKFDPSTQSYTEFYYIELRAPSGTYDNFDYNDDIVNGVSIRLGPDNGACEATGDPNCSSRLINPNPEINGTEAEHAVLKPGMAFEDPFATRNDNGVATAEGLSFETVAINKGTSTSQPYADVRISYVNPACNLYPPSLFVSPASQTGFAGTDSSYIVTVYNNDNILCPPAEFNMYTDLPIGLSTNLTTSLTLGPGQAGLAYLKVSTSDPELKGTFDIGVWAYRSPTLPIGKANARYILGSGAFVTAASLTYNVITQDTAAPSVKINSPVSGSTVGVRTNVPIDTQVTDNLGVTKVEFLVNNQIVCTLTSPTSASSYYCSAFTTGSKRGITYTILVKAYDAAGNIGTATVTVKT